MPNANQLPNRVGNSAFAFRGYNITNLGRTPELLAHPIYGSYVESHLAQAGRLCSEVVGRPVDLVDRVRRGEETRDLNSYAADVALIVAVELAQLRILEDCFGIKLAQARFVFGYSLGEAAALMATGVYAMEHLLAVPLALTGDTVALAQDVTMGVLFSRGPVLDLPRVKRLCLEINQEARGTIGISTFLSPNSLLLLGQRDAVDRFKARMRQALPEQTFLRKNPYRWPPLHTPITWQRSIPDRAARLLETTPGGVRAPSPPILSGVTGEQSYDDLNSRDILQRWVDQPQQLWEVVCQTLASGVDTVVHVGPAPNLIPATFQRLSNNITARMQASPLGRLGLLHAVSHIVRRPWLDALLSSRTSLLRAPFIEHIMLEDWLLERKTPGKVSRSAIIDS